MVGFNLHRYDILLFCHGPTERIYVGIGRHFHGQVVHYGLRRFHGNIEQAPDVLNVGWRSAVVLIPITDVMISALWPSVSVTVIFSGFGPSIFGFTRNVFVPFPYWVNVVRGTSEP